MLTKAVALIMGIILIIKGITTIGIILITISIIDYILGKLIDDWTC